MRAINNFLKVIFAVLFLTATVEAQNDNVPGHYPTRPFNLSFITPLGTNGMESPYIANNFSLNLLTGYNGGVKGAEIAGLYNISRGEMTGVQISGFGNTNNETVNGCQIAGFANTSKKDVTGIQIAGFTNVVAGNVDAAQISGFVNVSNDTLNGLQLAGFSNVSNKIGTGVQISGFTNINRSDAKGCQITGFSNVNNGDIEGVQISGFVNRAKKVKGAQIGFINLADSVDGASIGFLSFVKDGYRTIEISGNESFYGVVSFKTGTNNFYNIISLGTRIQNNTLKWGWGYGIGTMFPVSDKVNINLEGVSYHINEDAWWTNRLNLLNKLNLTGSVQLNDNIVVFGGMTWNVFVTDAYDRFGEPLESSIVNWSVYDRTIRNKSVTMYPGFSFGVRF